MPAEIDSLEIKLTANAQSANRSITSLTDKLSLLSSALTKVSGTNLTSLSTGVENLATAMTGMKAVGTADFSRLTKNLDRLANVNSATLDAASTSLNRLANSLTTLGSVKVTDNVTQITSLASAISKLGYKSAGQAVANIPKLADAMSRLMTTLSVAPKVSQNLIDMTNALSNLALNSNKVSQSSRGVSTGFNLMNTSTKKLHTSTFSLASAIGKVYATYFLLFRLFTQLRKAIDISSGITEVQNVVDNTFGDFSNKVEDLTNSAITKFGMSELTVKEISSRFQAMGTALGYTKEQMSDMSVSLTKLTADMSSFYNVEQSDAAQDLQAIFTGMSKPLRKYGIDITETTLKEWALAKGIDANVSKMTQAQKVMLRYQYVMERTNVLHGDFENTSDTWANQLRILKGNFQDLGKTIGEIAINSLKPLVSWLNLAIQKFNSFLVTVMNGLGKIFGWQYRASAGGTSDLTDDIEGLEDGLDGATNSAKKLKNALLGIDELNVLNDNSSSGSGSASASGDSFAAEYGVLERTEAEYKKYISSLENLYDLGRSISDKISVALLSIDWESIYEKAASFGSGLASYLNGRINPTHFMALGKTIADALNTAVEAAWSFGSTFDFENFGTSVAEGVNKFFSEFDFEKLGETINTWCSGIKDLIKAFFENLDAKEIFGALIDVLTSINIDTVEVLVGAFVLKWAGAKVAEMGAAGVIGKLLFGGGAVTTASKITVAIPELLLTIGKLGVANPLVLGQFGLWLENKFINGSFLDTSTWSGFPKKIDDFVYSIVDAIANAFNFEKTMEMVNRVKKSLNDAVSGDTFWDVGINIAKGVLYVLATPFVFIANPIYSFFDSVIKSFKDIFGIHSPAKNMYFIGENIVLGIVEGWKNAIPELAKIVKNTFGSVLDGLKEVWNNFATWLNEKLTFKIDPIVIAGKTLFDGANINLGKIPTFSTGGFPEDGLFMANSNELVGGFSNGKTAVANNQQIEYGIAYGVRQAVDEALGPYLVEIARNTKATADKDMSVNIGDREIARANIRGQSSIGRRLVTIG